MFEKASDFSSSLKPKRPQHSQDGECDASSTSCSQCDARENGNFEQGHRKGQKMSIIKQGTKPSGHSVIHFDKRFLQSFPQRQIKNRQQLYKTKESEKNKLEIYEDSHHDDPGCMTYGNWYKVLWREWKKQAKRIVSSEADAGSSSDESISDEKEKIFHNNKKSSFDTRDTRRPSDSRNKLNKHFVTNENLAFPSSEDVEVKIESWDKVTYSKKVPAVQPCLILKSKIIYINPLTPDVFSHVSIQNHMEKVQSEGKAGTKTSGQIAVTKTAGQIAVTKTSGQIRKLMLLKEEHQAKRQKVQMKHGRLLEILKDSEKEKNGKKYYVIKHQEKMKKNKKFVRYTVSTKECIKHHKGRESTRLIPEQMSDDWLNCLPEEVRNKFINRSKSIHPEDSSAHFKLLVDITNTSEKTGEKPKKCRRGDDCVHSRQERNRAYVFTDELFPGHQMFSMKKHPILVENHFKLLYQIAHLPGKTGEEPKENRNNEQTEDTLGDKENEEVDEEENVADNFQENDENSVTFIQLDMFTTKDQMQVENRNNEEKEDTLGDKEENKEAEEEEEAADNFQENDENPVTSKQLDTFTTKDPMQVEIEKVQSEGKAVKKNAGQIAVTKTSGQIRKLVLLKEEHQAKRQKVHMKHGRLLEILKDSEKEKNEEKYVIKHRDSFDTRNTRRHLNSMNKYNKHFVPAFAYSEDFEVNIESWDRVKYYKIAPSVQFMTLDSDIVYKHPLTLAASSHVSIRNQNRNNEEKEDTLGDKEENEEVDEEEEVADNFQENDENPATSKQLDTVTTRDPMQVEINSLPEEVRKKFINKSKSIQPEDSFAHIKLLADITATSVQTGEKPIEDSLAHFKLLADITTTSGKTEEEPVKEKNAVAEKWIFNNHAPPATSGVSFCNEDIICLNKGEYQNNVIRSEYDSTFIRLYRNIIRNETCRMMTSIDMVVSEAESLFGVERTRIFFDLLDGELFNFGSAGAISNFLPNMAESAVRQHVTSFFEQACDMMNRLMTLLLVCPDSKKLQQMPEPTFMSLLQSVIVYFLSNNKTKRGQSDKGTQIKRLIMLEPGLFVVAVGEEIPEDILVRFRHGDETVMNSFVDAGLEIMQASQIQDSRPICTPHLPDNAKLFIYIPTENGSYWHKMDMLRDNRIHRHGK